MKTKKLNDIVNSKVINIPLFIFKYKSKLKLDGDSFLFLMYLYSYGEKVLFDPYKFSEDLSIEYQNIMSMVSNLCELSLISLDTVKDKNGINEYISLEQFNSKLLSYIIADDVTSEESESTNIYDRIQEEFGRTLSPIEYEIINAWCQSNISEELINEALKEAVFNGVNNLRYIDKILYEWQKKGYKTKADIEKSRDKWKNKDKSSKPKKDVFDYNWLEDDQDE